MSFAVRYSASARDDLIRLYQFLLDRASTVEDLDVAERALSAITSAVDSLGRSPFIYRKAGQSPFLRELLIPFGHSGYVALFEIEDASTVTILAVRHQLEDDYHWLTGQIRSVADQYAQGRIVSCLEGGYDLGALARSVEAHLRALSDA